jgi:uncharacterized protein (TIGR03083 family)
MSDAPAFLAHRLNSEGEKLLAMFRSLSESQWSAAVYTEGTTWTVRSILAHLVTAERGFVQLFEQIRRGGPGAPDDFSVDRFNELQQRRSQTLSTTELLEQFRSVRAEMSSWVSGLAPAELTLTGRHPFLGMTTLEEMIKMVYRHNQIHLRDMRKALGSA